MGDQERWLATTLQAASGSIVPDRNNTYNLGSSAARWGALNCVDINVSNDITVTAGGNIVLATATGTQIGTAANQLLGFHGAAPSDQAATIVDADGNLADITTKFNTLLAALEEKGLLASS